MSVLCPVIALSGCLLSCYSRGWLLRGSFPCGLFYFNKIKNTLSTFTMSLFNLFPDLNCSVPEIANATSSASVVRADESTQYGCNVGYFLMGNDTAICNGNNGSLSFMQKPTCHCKSMYYESNLTFWRQLQVAIYRFVWVSEVNF